MSGQEESFERTRRAGRTVYDVAREAMVAGLAVIVPIIVTVLVLNVVAGYIFSALNLLVTGLERAGISPAASEIIVRATVLAVLVGIVFVVGFITRFRYGERIIYYVDRTIERLPGVGAVYESFREMSDVLIESDAESFREVKLVEFPHEGTYTLGFVTAETSATIREAAGEPDMLTLFLPLAPNPVMGGHLAHVSTEKVHDVDLTVEEGIRTVVTTGVAANGDGGATPADGGLSESELRQINRFEAAEGQVAPGDGNAPRGASGPGEEGAPDDDRTSQYRHHAGPDDPRREETPDGVGSHQVPETDLGREAARPEEIDGETWKWRDLTRMDADAVPADIETDDSVDVGADAARPGELAPDADREELGADAAHPEDLAADDDDGSLGSDASRPADLATDDDEELGSDADRPRDIDGEGD